MSAEVARFVDTIFIGQRKDSIHLRSSRSVFLSKESLSRCANHLIGLKPGCGHYTILLTFELT